MNSQPEKSDKKFLSNSAILYGIAIVLIFLLIYKTKLFRRNDEIVTEKPKTDSIKTPSKPIETVKIGDSALEEKDEVLGKLIEIRLLDGSLIRVPENGVERKLVEYIEAKCGTSELKKTWFDLDRIKFKPSTHNILIESNEQLLLIAKIIKSYPNKKFKIGGYTDNQGDPEMNIKLSADRAAAAMRAIANFGADSTKIRYEGYGQEHPICPENNTEECRAKNRRISIRVDVCK